MGAAIDYLVTVFRAAPTLGLATPPVTVFDGPSAADDDGPGQLQLFVGIDDPAVNADTPDAAFTANGLITWAGIGPKARYETFTVPCAAVAWSGDGDTRTVRLAALGIFNAADALIVPTDVDLGGTVLYVESVSYSLRQDQYEDGAVAWVQFGFQCKARLP
jgi:hypothetical protein